MVKDALLIGPSGIGQVHLRELLKKKISKIYLVGKKYKRDRVKKIKFKVSKKTKLLNLTSITKAKKNFFNLVCICSPTDQHYKHLNMFKNFSKYIIVEKPFLWEKNKNTSNYNLIKKILESKKVKIFTNLPMISLASQLKKEREFKKIKNVTFNYYTKGKKRFKDIPIDLLPHALSFVLTLINKKIYKFKIIKILKEESLWKCKVVINNCYCKFNFKQDKNRTESFLSFAVNNNHFSRKQIKQKYTNEYVTKLLLNKQKIIHIRNPFTDYYLTIMNNLKKSNILKKNNTITLISAKMMETLVN